MLASASSLTTASLGRFGEQRCSATAHDHQRPSESIHKVFSSVRSLPLVRLVRRGSSRFDLDFAGLVIFAGLANAALLAIFNAAAENASNEAANGRLLVLFGVTIGLYAYAQRYILFTSITERGV